MCLSVFPESTVWFSCVGANICPVLVAKSKTPAVDTGGHASNLMESREANLPLREEEGALAGVFLKTGLPAAVALHQA